MIFGGMFTSRSVSGILHRVEIVARVKRHEWVLCGKQVETEMFREERIKMLILSSPNVLRLLQTRKPRSACRDCISASCRSRSRTADTTFTSRRCRRSLVLQWTTRLASIFERVQPRYILTREVGIVGRPREQRALFFPQVQRDMHDGRKPTLKDAS